MRLGRAAARGNETAEVSIEDAAAATAPRTEALLSPSYPEASRSACISDPRLLQTTDPFLRQSIELPGLLGTFGIYYDETIL